ncbi:MAG: succinylglutamate desuccinylase/aspartoacylase family protein [Chromatiales bacterium]|nr:succinylglutamate desuccinylase/aspartoacylase family protein [Chromatiales bacterium]
MARRAPVVTADPVNQPVTIGDVTVRPGNRALVLLPVTVLYTSNPVEMPVHVICGKRPGPRLFISAAIHGDELNGIEIIRRLLKSSALRHLRGTLIAVPIVNVFGVLNHSRYLPDRRDLNRSFPGSDHGSLTARLAHLFMEEIVAKCTHGIDLHTGALHRDNLPQIRAHMDDEETARLARAFGVPVLLNSVLRDGSLRQAADESGIKMLLYEAGEALRFDEVSIRVGVAGILNVMRELGMIAARHKKPHRPRQDPITARASSWIRAPQGGIFRAFVRLGEWIERDTVLGMVSDPMGVEEEPILSPNSGIVIGRANLPLVNEGDALFHVARFDRSRQGEHAAVAVAELHDFHEGLPPDETEIR